MGECILEMVRHHKILCLIFDEILNWKEHLKIVKARASKKRNLLNNLHQMGVLSKLRYGETIYGLASKSAQRTIEPVHHKGVKIALGVFAICKTENALCEAGLPTLTEKRELNTTMVATRILTNKDHPIRHFFMEDKIQV
jgi:hypothetical protein